MKLHSTSPRSARLRAPARALLVAALIALASPAHADRTATYQPGALTFSQNVALRAPVATRDGEPSVRVDIRGNCYVGAIRGVPAGVDLWRFDLNPSSPTFDPGMQSPVYLGQPDAFMPTDPDDPTTGGADGGGDIDISVSFPTHPDSVPVLTISSLALANVSSASSRDLGVNFLLSPAVAAAPADDRQWNESTGESTVYLLYRAPIPATGLFVQRSDDHGLTYPIVSLVSPNGTSPGYIDVDHATGRVYVAHSASNAMRVSRSTDLGVTWALSTVDNSTIHGALFDVVKVGSDGTVYALWSNVQNVYLSHSTDGGVTWAQKVRVNDNAVYKTNLMPWLEAGSDGRVCAVWFASTSPVNDDGADWVVQFAQCLDAKSATPTFRQQVISDHVIHGSNISLGGLTGGANRNLIDYFQVALDPQGAAVVAFTDDHNDFEGHTYVTRQLDGTSLDANANGGSGLVNAASPPPLPGQDFGLPEVTDFLHDATSGLLQPILADSPVDVLWIDYACDNLEGDPAIVATMKLSDLTAIPSGVQWRVNFTANAPGTSPGVPGTSDNGQQFWMSAGTDTQSVQSFQWGTAERAGDGTTSYTDRGACDFGLFDQTNGTVVLKVKLDQLNAYASPDITFGSVLCGLRGQTLEPGLEPAGNRHPLRDHTRGGGTFTVPGCGIVDVAHPSVRTERSAFVGAPNPNPTSGSTSLQFRLAATGLADLAVYDLNGRRVRTLVASVLPAGTHERSWDGRTDRFSAAPSGVYFVKLNTVDGVSVERVVLAR